MLDSLQNVTERRPSPAPSAGAERRGGERTVTVLRIARLLTSSGDFLGIVRNVSRHGMMIEVHPDQSLGGSIQVDLGDGRPFSGEVRWREGAAPACTFPSRSTMRRYSARAEPGNPGKRPASLGCERVIAPPCSFPTAASP